jgi:hypothetical protein
MKRQRGRNRKPGGGGGGQNNNPNRSFDSQGPEGIKVRGNAQTCYERYQQLARDAFASGDRVLAESYLQHAEHYFRVLRVLQPQRSWAEIAQREALNQGFDIDLEDESGQPVEFVEGPQQDGGDLSSDVQGGDDGRREFRQDRGERRDRWENREGRDRDNRDRGRGEFDRDRGERREGPDHRDRVERRDGEPRELRPEGERRYEGETREGGRRETRRERFERRRAERDGAPRRDYADQDQPSADAWAGREAPASYAEEVSPPRPAREPLAAAAEAESHLPAFLSRSAAPMADALADAPDAPSDEVAAEEKPRRPRRRVAPKAVGED